MRQALTGGVVMVAFIVLLGGHGMGHPWLTYLVPGGATMQPLTALSFIAAGPVVALATRPRGILGASAVAGLLTYMAVLGLAGWSGLWQALGVHEIVVQVRPPSFGTIVGFGAVELVGLLALARRDYRAPGWLMLGVGCMAVLGYAVDAPVLYFDVDGTTGMAIHTALCFVALGAACLVPREEEV